VGCLNSLTTSKTELRADQPRSLSLSLLMKLQAPRSDGCNSGVPVVLQVCAANAEARPCHLISCRTCDSTPCEMQGWTPHSSAITMHLGKAS